MPGPWRDGEDPDLQETFATHIRNFWVWAESDGSSAAIHRDSRGLKTEHWFCIHRGHAPAPPDNRPRTGPGEASPAAGHSGNSQARPGTRSLPSSRPAVRNALGPCCSVWSVLFCGCPRSSADPGRRPLGAGALLLQAARHRGLPEPGAADDRDHHPAQRLERRGGRALRHRPAGDRPLRDAGPRPHPLAVALRAVRREVLLHLGHRLHTARQEVINRLQFVSLPPGMPPQLSPWNAIGEIFRYVVAARATR